MSKRRHQPGMPTRPLDAPQLRSLALFYAGRYATTRHKLKQYLTRKIRERGWEGEAAPDVEELAETFAGLGYVDDQRFADNRAASLMRRGYGPGRVRTDLHHAGINSEMISGVAKLDDDEALAVAIAFARKKRFGPFGGDMEGRKAYHRALAAMIRAGHGHDLARKALSVTAPDAIQA